MSAHKTLADMKRARVGTSDFMLRTPANYKLFHFVNTTPTDGTDGYAPGCIALDYTNGAMYYNSGTAVLLRGLVQPIQERPPLRL